MIKIPQIPEPPNICFYHLLTQVHKASSHQDGVVDGYSEVTNVMGDQADGIFRKGYLTGQATIRFKDGHSYEGNMRRNNAEGMGTLFTPKYSIKAQWKAGKPLKQITVNLMDSGVILRQFHESFTDEMTSDPRHTHQEFYGSLKNTEVEYPDGSKSHLKVINSDIIFLNNDTPLTVITPSYIDKIIPLTNGSAKIMYKSGDTYEGQIRKFSPSGVGTGHYSYPDHIEPYVQEYIKELEEELGDLSVFKTAFQNGFPTRGIGIFREQKTQNIFFGKFGQSISGNGIIYIKSQNVIYKGKWQDYTIVEEGEIIDLKNSKIQKISTKILNSGYFIGKLPLLKNSDEYQYEGTWNNQIFQGNIHNKKMGLFFENFKIKNKIILEGSYTIRDIDQNGEQYFCKIDENDHIMEYTGPLIIQDSKKNKIFAKIKKSKFENFEKKSIKFYDNNNKKVLIYKGECSPFKMTIDNKSPFDSYRGITSGIGYTPDGKINTVVEDTSQGSNNIKRGIECYIKYSRYIDKFEVSRNLNCFHCMVINNEEQTKLVMNGYTTVFKIMRKFENYEEETLTESLKYERRNGDKIIFGCPTMEFWDGLPNKTAFRTVLELDGDNKIVIKKQ